MTNTPQEEQMRTPEEILADPEIHVDLERCEKVDRCDYDHTCRIHKLKKFVEHAKIDLPAMAWRVIELTEQLDEAKDIATQWGAERDKLAAQVEELNNQLFCEGCGSTPTENQKEFNKDCVCGSRWMKAEDCIKFLVEVNNKVSDNNDALRKELAEAKACIQRGVDAELRNRNIPKNTVWRFWAERDARKLLADTEQAG